MNALQNIWQKAKEKITGLKAVRWLVNKIKAATKSAQIHLNKGDLRIGAMYSYAYDAKWKDALPYWDSLPLTVIIHFYPDGFLGLNLHYLDLANRRALLKMLERMGTTRTREFKVTYGKLLALSNSMWKYTIHRYLYSHIKSGIAIIEKEEWDMTLALPVNSFKKMSAQQVWSLQK